VNPNLSIVIPTWRGRHLLEAYLASVTEAAAQYHATRAADVEVVVVDDAGGDDTGTWLADRHRDIRLIQHTRNLGFAAACWTGFQAAMHPLVLLLNNDVRLKRDCIAPMVEHFADPLVFAVTGKMFNQNEDVFCNGGKVAHFRRGMWSTYENYDLLPGIRPDLTLLSFTAIGAFSIYDRPKFLEIGGFDQLAAMVEDVEISYRAWKRGWTVKYEPRSIAYHDASQTMDKRYKRRRLDMLSRRNWIMMHWMLLHDGSMFRRHLLAITARFLTSWLILDWRFYWGIATGLSHLRMISRKRKETRRTMARSDRELLALLDRFYRTAPIALRKA
jgi:GT2 family glycosyltransferase